MIYIVLGKRERCFVWYGLICGALIIEGKIDDEVQHCIVICCSCRYETNNAMRRTVEDQVQWIPYSLKVGSLFRQRRGAQHHYYALKM